MMTNKYSNDKNLIPSDILKKLFGPVYIDPNFENDYVSFPVMKHNISDFKQKIANIDLGTMCPDGATMKCWHDEENNKFITSVAVPGVPKEDITVRITGRVVKIDYKSESTEKNSRFVRTGGFDYTLHEDTDTESVVVKLENGVLTVTETLVEKPEDKEITLDIQ